MFSFFIIVFATLFYCSFDFLIYFQCIILSFLIFRWIVILILFLPRSFSAVLLFSHVFSVSLFFQTVLMISFLIVIFFTCCSFVHCAFCSSGFLFAFHLSVLSTIRFYQAGYFVGLSYGVSVELFVVLFSFLLFLKLEYILHFIIISTLTIQHCFTLIQLLLFQPT